LYSPHPCGSPFGRHPPQTSAILPIFPRAARRGRKIFASPACGGSCREATEGGALDLARDLRVPVCRGEGRTETSVRIARTMRASSLHAQGRAFNEPRHALAYRRRRRGIRGAFSLVIFLLCEQEKVTRAPDARGKPNGRGRRRINSKVNGFPLRACGNDEQEQARTGFPPSRE